MSYKIETKFWKDGKRKRNLNINRSLFSWVGCCMFYCILLLHLIDLNPAMHSPNSWRISESVASFSDPLPFLAQTILLKNISNPNHPVASIHQFHCDRKMGEGQTPIFTRSHPLLTTWGELPWQVPFSSAALFSLLTGSFPLAEKHAIIFLSWDNKLFPEPMFLSSH